MRTICANRIRSNPDEVSTKLWSTNLRDQLCRSIPGGNVEVLVFGMACSTVIGSLTSYYDTAHPDTLRGLER